MDSEETLLGSESGPKSEIISPSTRSTKPWRPWFILILCNIFLFCTSIGVFFSASYSHSVRNAALKATSIYSPILDEVDLTLKMTAIEGAIVPDENITPWGGVPGPETDSAWKQFEHIKVGTLSRDQIKRMGKDPSKVAKYEDAVFHLGEDAYVGALDIFHQIHCLNALRKKAFADYPIESESQGNATEAEWKSYDWVHLRHCTGMLMQHLLCGADTGMLTYYWMENQRYPFPDFSVNKKCKDWTQLTNYRDEHAVDPLLYKAWTKPANAYAVPKSQGFKDLEQEAENENAHDHHHGV